MQAKVKPVNRYIRPGSKLGSVHTSIDSILNGPFIVHYLEKPKSRNNLSPIQWNRNLKIAFTLTFSLQGCIVIDYNL